MQDIVRENQNHARENHKHAGQNKGEPEPCNTEQGRARTMQDINREKLNHAG
jgi:hypothetical protein